MGGGDHPLEDASRGLYVDHVLRRLVALEVEPSGEERRGKPARSDEEGDARLVEAADGGTLVGRGVIAEHLEERRVETRKVVLLRARLECEIGQGRRGDEAPSVERLRAGVELGASARRGPLDRRRGSAGGLRREPPLEVAGGEVVPEPILLRPAVVGDVVETAARGHGCGVDYLARVPGCIRRRTTRLPGNVEAHDQRKVNDGWRWRGRARRGGHGGGRGRGVEERLRRSIMQRDGRR